MVSESTSVVGHQGLGVTPEGRTGELSPVTERWLHGCIRELKAVSLCVYLKPKPQESEQVLRAGWRTAPFSRGPGSRAGCSCRRGRGRGRRSAAASCSTSWAAGRARCSSSSRSCMSSGRRGRGWGRGGAGRSRLDAARVLPSLPLRGWNQAQ